MVFEVTDIASDLPFAMKILGTGNNAQAAFEFDGEGQLLQKLARRSHVIDWYGSNSTSVDVSLNGRQVPLDVKYHVMALASGSVNELLDDPDTFAALTWEDRLGHWRGAVKGVHQMHLSHVAHRDLKASNCLLMVDGGGNSEVRIGDLGRSKDFSQPPSFPPSEYYFGRGDPRYSPPEYLWCQGGFTERDFRCADLYGLGSLFVELATGHPMTALAVVSIPQAHLQGAQDRRNQYRRDLSALRPSFHRAIEHMALQVPAKIRPQAVALVRQLCDPVPEMRLPRSTGKPPKAPTGGLEWLLRSADILVGGLTVDRSKRSKSSNKAMNGSAT